jgi:hypothetical protein
MSDTLIDLPSTMVDLPNTMVDLPNTVVDLPKTMTVFFTVFDRFWPVFVRFWPVWSVLTVWTVLDHSWPFLYHFWTYRHGLMVLTTTMVFAQTDGIELVLLNHTCTRGPSVTRMQDFYRRVKSQFMGQGGISGSRGVINPIIYLFCQVTQ